MEEQGKALTSKRPIEVILKVPVILCPVRMEAVETGIKGYFPDLIRNGSPFFIIRSMVGSLQSGTLYHIADFIDSHYNLFLYDGNSQVFIADPYLVHPVDTAFCEQILQDNGKNLPLLIPSANSASSCPQQATLRYRK